MAKKTSKRKRKKLANIDYAACQVKALANIAKGKLAKGCFAQAVEAYKELLKKDGSGSYMSGFNKAYKGRILELAAKGMYKEALVFYKNMVSISGTDDHELHLVLLFNSGRFEQALEIYPVYLNTGSKPRDKEITVFIAALLLTGDYHDLVDKLPAESLVRIHYPFAIRALSEFETGNFAGVEENLQKISFKSPYKDFRIILQSLMAVRRNEIAKAASLARKVAVESPFYALASPFLIGNDSEKIKTLTAVKGAEFDYRSAVFNIPSSTAALVVGLSKNAANPNRLFEYLIKHTFPAERQVVWELCRQLLPYVCNRLKCFQKEFGPFDEFESSRVRALFFEINNDIPEAVKQWQIGLDILSDDKDNFMIMGAVLRHIFQLVREVADHITGLDKKEILTESLRYDPLHKPTYMQLFEFSFPVKKHYYYLVETAVKYFPDDVEILLEGVKAAISKGAFKKTARLAARLLQVDPLNNKAGSLLIEAHISHGHKLYRSGKKELARKEFKEAVKIDCRNTDLSLALICAGLVTIITADSCEGRRLLAQGQGQAGSKVVAALAAAVEARILRASASICRELDKKLKAVNKTAPVRDDIAGIISLIKKVEKTGGSEVGKTFKLLKTFLNKTAKFEYEEVEFRGYCDFFLSYKEYTLLKTFAAAAVRIYPHKPVFVYYHVFALSEGAKKPLSESSFSRLEEAEDLAVEQDDFSLLELIDDFKENYYDESYDSYDSKMSFFKNIMENIPSGLDVNEILEEVAADLDGRHSDIEAENKGVPWEPDQSFMDIDLADVEVSKPDEKSGKPNKKQLNLFS